MATDCCICPFRGSFGALRLSPFVMRCLPNWKLSCCSRTRACRQLPCRDRARDQPDDRRKALAGPVVAPRHRPELLGDGEECLDLVSPAIGVAVVLARLPPALLRRDRRRARPRPPVVSPRRMPGLRSAPERMALQKRGSTDEIVRLPGHDHEPYRIPERVRGRPGDRPIPWPRVPLLRPTLSGAPERWCSPRMPAQGRTSPTKRLRRARRPPREPGNGSG